MHGAVREECKHVQQRARLLQAAPHRARLRAPAQDGLRRLAQLRLARRSLCKVLQERLVRERRQALDLGAAICRVAVT